MFISKIKKIVQAVLPDDVAVALQIEHPQSREHGDFSTNVAMQLASQMKKGLVAQIQENTGDDFEAIEAVAPGFINFTLSKKTLLHELSLILMAGDRYGASKSGAGKKAIIEHTSVNPNKSMHVGHIRNSVLGDVVARLHRWSGYDVEVQNYIDDTGVQVADIVVGLKHFSKRSKTDGQKFDAFCWDVYSDIQKEFEADESLKEKRYEVLKALEEGKNEISEYADHQVVDKILWDHLDTLEKFRIYYDVYIAESSILSCDLWSTAFEQLQEAGHIVLETEGENAGTWVMKDLDLPNKDQMKNPDKILITSKGNIVYTAKDIAYHLWKFGLLGKDFQYYKFFDQKNGDPLFMSSYHGEEKGHFGKADKVITVVDVRQTYPQQVVKAAFVKMGYTKQAENLHHLAYGLVALSSATAKQLGVDVSDGKKSYAMSGRQGIGVKVDDFFDVVEKKVLELREGETSEDMVESRDVASAAVRAYLLKYNTNNEVVFDIDDALNLTGDSGPYLQYTHARIKGILRKLHVKSETLKVKNDISLSDKEEIDLLRHLYMFSEVIDRSTSEMQPNIVYTYLLELAQAFNTFYALHSVTKEVDETKKNGRVLLITAVGQVLKNGLDVLGMVAPEKM